MRFVSRHFAISIGYQLHLDAWGITLCLGERQGVRGRGDYRYRWAMQCACVRPLLLWAEEAWAINERGYLRGMPVARRGIASSAWTGRAQWVRGVSWFRHFSIRRYEDDPA